MVKEKFDDRNEAGTLLAKKLTAYKNDHDVVVVALPRGGVPVAYEIAASLHLPLELLLVRKLGTPHNPELAMGAIAMNGVFILDEDLIHNLNISSQQIEKIIEAEKKELQRRMQVYQSHRPSALLKNRKIIVVDDGIATGASMRAAIKSIKAQQPKEIIIAIPVVDPSIYEALSKEVNQIIYLLKPQRLYSVGSWYDDFSQLSDEEVKDYLNNSFNVSH